MFTRFIEYCRKKPFFAVCFVIAIFYCVFAVPLLVFGAIDRTPDRLYTATGVVAETKHHEKSTPNIIDFIFAYSDTAYFDVRFEDGSFFHTVGINYDHLDKIRLSDLSVGTEITVLYDKKGFFSGPDILYGIECNGITYLDSEVVLSETQRNNREISTGCWIALGVLTAVAGIAVAIAYPKTKRLAAERNNS